MARPRATGIQHSLTVLRRANIPRKDNTLLSRVNFPLNRATILLSKGITVLPHRKVTTAPLLNRPPDTTRRPRSLRMAMPLQTSLLPARTDSHLRVKHLEVTGRPVVSLPRESLLDLR